MFEIVLPLTLIAFIANIGFFVDSFDIFYLPPIFLALYIFKVLASDNFDVITFT